MAKLGDRLVRGEQAAFAELYDACADRLHHYLTLRLGSREDAEDVLQNTFVRLAKARSRLGEIENMIAYVFKIARNESANFLGRKGRDADFLKARGSELFHHNNAGEDHLAGETVEIVTAALAKLTSEQREIVELKFYAGLTFSEISEVVEIPQGTAATRYRVAMQRMREWFLKGHS